jgi:hypothetical protein
MITVWTGFAFLIIYQLDMSVKLMRSVGLSPNWWVSYEPPQVAENRKIRAPYMPISGSQ